MTQYALILSKSSALTAEFVKCVEEQKIGLTVITPGEIASSKKGKAYLVNQFIDEFLTLDTLRRTCNNRQPDYVLLYILNTKEDKWVLSEDEENAFDMCISNDGWKSMKDFVCSLR